MIICGIDEAGRGPMAGPLVMAGVVLEKDIKGLNDSKKLSAKKRELLFDEITQNSKYKIVKVNNVLIDEKGLSWAIKYCLKEIISNLSADRYIFDGNTSFGIIGVESLIKGDEKIKQISAASILAKVTRDKIMVEMAQKYPQYGFEKHKGYITKAHIENVKKFGYSDIHRKSYKIKSLMQKTLF